MPFVRTKQVPQGHGHHRRGDAYRVSSCGATWDWWRDNPRQRYETTRDVTSRSTLAEKLLPPTSITAPIKPVEDPVALETRELQTRQTPGIGIGLWVGALMTILFGCMTFAVFSGSSQSPNSPVVCLFPILMIMGIAITVFFDRKRKKAVVDHSRIPDDIRVKVDAQRQRYQAYLEHERRQALAIQRYQRLFYCEVCGKVFDPNDGVSHAVPVEQSLYLDNGVVLENEYNAPRPALLDGERCPPMLRLDRLKQTAAAPELAFPV